MHTILVGVNHNKADIDIREKIFFPLTSLEKATNKLLTDTKIIDGTIIISTCNRVEIYASSTNISEAFEYIIDFIAKFHKIERYEFEHLLYKKHCQSAVMHLFKVVAGLDSMIIGEFEIQGQVKNAYKLAEKYKSTDSLLNKLFQTAIQIGKKSRSQTALSSGSLSMGSIISELLKSLFDHQTPIKILWIGAGGISDIILKNIKKSFPVSQLFFTNRTEKKAQQLAQAFKGVHFPFENLLQKILDFDIVIAATASSGYILNKNDISREVKQKTCFIDISVPRNIDPFIKNINNIVLYSMDDLSGLINNNITLRQAEITKVKTIIDEIFEEYYEWYNLQTVVPIMQRLKIEFDNMITSTIQMYEPELKNMPKEEKHIVEKILKNHSDKIIRIIMKNLKKGTKPSNLHDVGNVLKKIFDINIK